MKLALVFLMVSTIACAAEAAPFEAVAIDRSSIWLVDAGPLGGVETVGALRRASVIMIPRDQPSQNRDVELASLIAIEAVSEWNCESREDRQLSYLLLELTAEHPNGRVVREQAATGAWASLDPGSTGEAVLDAMCGSGERAPTGDLELYFIAMSFLQELEGWR